VVSHHPQPQFLQAGVERELRDRCGQQPVDRRDQLDKQVELALVALGPGNWLRLSRKIWAQWKVLRIPVPLQSSAEPKSSTKTCR